MSFHSVFFKLKNFLLSCFCCESTINSLFCVPVGTIAVVFAKPVSGVLIARFAVKLNNCSVCFVPGCASFNRPLRCQHSFPALPGFLLHPDSQCCSSTLAPKVFQREKKSTIVLSSSLLNGSPAQHTSPVCSSRPGRSFSPALTAVCCRP